MDLKRMNWNKTLAYPQLRSRESKKRRTILSSRMNTGDYFRTSHQLELQVVGRTHPILFAKARSTILSSTSAIANSVSGRRVLLRLKPKVGTTFGKLECG